MSFPVVTGSFGTVDAGTFALSWDTDTPRGDAPADPGEAVILDGISASWATDVLPPVASPNTVTLAIYQASPDAGDQWLPLDLGLPIKVTAHAYTAAGSVALFVLDGRVADLQATNHPDGGVVFALVIADRLADLGATNGPNEFDVLGIDPANAGNYIDIPFSERLIAEDAGITFDRAHDGDNTQSDWFLNAADYSQTATLEALSAVVAHDVRDGVFRWLTTDVDDTVTTPTDPAVFCLNRYDPEADDVAGVTALHWTGTQWVVQLDPAYYAGGGVGLVLDAGNLAADVGTWRKTRDQAINTIELTGNFDRHYVTDPDFDLVLPDPVSTVRRTFSDLVSLYGRNARSMPSPLAFRLDAQAFGDLLLGPHNQVQVTGYGFTQALVAWETLSAAQIAAWGDALFPRFGVAPLGRAYAITNVPDDWRLADGPVITGRLMGVTITLQAGVVRPLLTTRAVPPIGTGAITYNQAGTAPHTLTPNTVDPSITVHDLALVGPTFT